MFETLLLPTDGSDQALQAAHHALELARLCQARLVVLSVREPYPLAGGVMAGAAGLQSYMAESREAADKAFARVQQLATAAGVAIETRVEDDRPAAEGIVEAAQALGAELIVIGSHGRSGIARLLLGSVASKVITLAKVPVLVVR
jgi:nucleotide-binding universal stress UspA family protein